MSNIWAWLLTPEPVARGLLISLALVIVVLLAVEDIGR